MKSVPPQWRLKYRLAHAQRCQNGNNVKHMICLKTVFVVVIAKTAVKTAE